MLWINFGYRRAEILKDQRYEILRILSVSVCVFVCVCRLLGCVLTVLLRERATKTSKRRCLATKEACDACRIRINLNQ